MTKEELYKKCLNTAEAVRIGNIEFGFKKHANHLSKYRRSGEDRQFIILLALGLCISLNTAEAVRIGNLKKWSLSGMANISLNTAEAVRIGNV